MTDKTYLIIGGAARAGTTSLFKYLGDHPAICPSSVKETGFFLDKDYPFPKTRKYHYSDGIELYNLYFQECKTSRFRLEATPAYLYSQITPKWIYESFTQTKFLFILRDPIKRLISCYLFLKQIGQLPNSVSFEAYIQEQLNTGSAYGSRCLVTGLYSKYILNYLDFFSKNDIYIIHFEELTLKPIISLKKIFKHLDLPDSSFYDNYVFSTHNKSLGIKYKKIHKVFLRISNIISHRMFPSNPKLQKLLKHSRYKIEKIYYRLNSKEPEIVLIHPTLKSVLLESYYSDQEIIKDRFQIESHSDDNQSMD